MASATRDNRAALRVAIDQWHTERSSAPDDEVERIDAYWADRVGLPTLSAILTAEVLVRRAATETITRAELADTLSGIRQTLIGEATERVRRLLRDYEHPGVPGIGIRPRQGSILETRYGPSGKGRPPKRPGYPAGTRRRSA